MSLLLGGAVAAIGAVYIAIGVGLVVFGICIVKGIKGR